jgi:hypothetical protein
MRPKGRENGGDDRCVGKIHSLRNWRRTAGIVEVITAVGRWSQERGMSKFREASGGNKRSIKRFASK